MPNPELELFAAAINWVIRPEDMFGVLLGSKEAQLAAAHTFYRKFALIAHADRYTDPAEKALAHEAFTKLQTLWSQVKTSLENGTYGKPRPAEQTIVISHTRKYRVTSGHAGGDLSNVYRAQIEGKKSEPSSDNEVLLKISRDEKNNVILEHESKILTIMARAAASTAALKQFIPDLIETFLVKDERGVKRVNAFTYRSGFYPLTALSLEYPEGIDPRHFAWIFNRLLSVLAFAHHQGGVHGAITPTNVLVHPVHHGLMLVDWCFSTRIGRPPVIYSTPYAAYYPPELHAGAAVTPAFDIYMAARCMIYILGGSGDEVPSSVDPRFRRFLEGCLIRNPARRPQSAWHLYEQFQEILTEVYGKRRFVKLEMST